MILPDGNQKIGSLVQHRYLPLPLSADTVQWLDGCDKRKTFPLLLDWYAHGFSHYIVANERVYWIVVVDKPE